MCMLGYFYLLFLRHHNITYCLAIVNVLKNEQLQTTFTSALGAGVQVDVWAFCQSVFGQGANYVKAMALWFMNIYIIWLKTVMSLKTLINLNSTDGI